MLQNSSGTGPAVVPREAWCQFRHRRPPSKPCCTAVPALPSAPDRPPHLCHDGREPFSAVSKSALNSVPHADPPALSAVPAPFSSLPLPTTALFGGGALCCRLQHFGVEGGQVFLAFLLMGDGRKAEGNEKEVRCVKLDFLICSAREWLSAGGSANGSGRLCEPPTHAYEVSYGARCYAHDVSRFSSPPPGSHTYKSSALVPCLCLPQSLSSL